MLFFTHDYYEKKTGELEEEGNDDDEQNERNMEL